MKCFIFTLFVSGSLLAQPTIVWQKCLGGISLDSLNSIQSTPDGGFITCGIAYSNFNGDVSGGYGGGDFWVVKLDPDGNIQWEKSLGGTWTDSAEDIQPTSDGGYIVAGVTTSNNGLVTGFHGERDFWVVKLNTMGDVDWQKALGGSNEEDATSITEAHDGGYLVTGYTASKDGDAQSPGFEYFDIWVVRLSLSGNILWEKRYGGNGGDLGYCIRKAKGSGYYLAGQTSSNDGDVSGLHGDYDCWVIKIDNEGSILWQHALGGLGTDLARSIFSTNDGGCIVAGTSGSGNSGDVSGHHGLFDAWIVKLDSLGEIQWQKPLGGSNSDYARCIVQTNDEGYAIAANTLSTDGDAQGHDGSEDIWIIKLDNTGNILWKQILGGSNAEIERGITKASDGGIVFCGLTRSNDGDVSGNHGSDDFWIVKLSPESSATTETITRPLGVWPNPATGPVRISTGESAGTLELALSDCTGKNILRLRMENNATTNLGALPDGLYFLQATDASGRRWLGKLIKQRE